MLFRFNSNAAIQKALGVVSADRMVAADFDIADDFDCSELFIDEIKDAKWPVAVDPLLLAMDTDADKKVRAELILELIVSEPLVNKKILDFGCGNGYVADCAGKTAVASYGYDIVSDPDWANHTKAIFTTDRAEIEKNAPYDIILVYDVFDHIMDNTHVETLKYLATIGKKIIVRFHPWCSKSGTHLYKTLNKAFAHFFLSESALVKYGYSILPTVKVLHPDMMYKQWIRQAGLTIVKETKSGEPLDPMFTQGNYAAMILKTYMTKKIGYFPTENLSSQFWDYTLKK
jgi:hypothetical protein